ncbi:pyruvate dehydrogenase complex dihydrolipoamide acetyltransferase [Plasmopara halstedii]|uniref:Pyruvate dehydrogenase complex dihydrolipoamide acetyltransferase n=1 Tax=Plasmopara halstedii TaxID=4781 RepID=A0A0P1AE60_PLAHL|nr:pyruvate dehydrogenase complex dihydrolipoamide acetyltransferase [Plasmopara halstedii]CEG39290.1 pyruvate dehydrogenase complex dihydrolipoamide acetyltransferase [Plasmopara halstedii]|eukprot:XP_024575659.1 pyruvate dehydrogenase complex dihydrolipoamide acetyltransferase [Plasmopara halstedii]
MLRSVIRLPSAVLGQRRIVACFSRGFSSYPPHDIVGLPSLSPTMETGNMSKWNTKEGDAITAGDIVCEIETDKAVVDYEATDDMFLAKILIPEGTENIPVGQPMMVVVEDQESVAAFKDFKLDEASVAPATPVSSKKPSNKSRSEPAMPQPSQKASPPMEVSPPTKTIEHTSTVLTNAKASSPVSATTTVFEEKWGFGIKKSAISTSLLKKQQLYIAQYGVTGMTPVALPIKE